MDVEKKLNEFLNIENEVIEVSTEEIAEIPDINTNIKEDQTSDYNYARTNYYDLHEKGMKGLEELLELAKDSQNARSYEVAAGMIKNLGELNKNLIELQKDMKELQGVENKVPTNVTNALFVGSTADLQKMLKKQNSEEG